MNKINFYGRYLKFINIIKNYNINKNKNMLFNCMDDKKNK